MSAIVAADPDEVSIDVGDKRFQGWQTVSITRSCEAIPNSFSLTASTEFLQGDALAGTRAGQPCTIHIGSDTAITGWIDRRSISVDAHSHQVTLSGRGITRNLIDCSADIAYDPALKGGQISGPLSTLAIAQRLSASYGITVRSAVADLGIPIQFLQVRLGETPYEIIESVARYAGYLVYEDENGVLVLDRVGTQMMASGFTMPGNIEAITADRSVDQRYSEYLVVWNGIAQLAELSATGNQRASAFDTTLGEKRLRIIESHQSDPPAGQPTDGNAIARLMANWEKGRRIGRAQAANITCDSWRDKPAGGGMGKLWQPNWLATIDAPRADISNATWIIGTVTYRKDASGTHTDLVLMPPDAFNPEPNALHLFDRELLLTPSTSQTPAPPSSRTQSNDGPGI
jgi:prophage tail gpP-like protein